MKIARLVPYVEVHISINLEEHRKAFKGIDVLVKKHSF